MDELSQAQQAKDTLESFLNLFNEYAGEIFGEHRSDHLDRFRTQLQKKEPQVTKLLVEILGDKVIAVAGFGRSVQIPSRDLLPTALMGGNNAEKVNFYDFNAPVTSLLTRAVGAIDTGLWPPTELSPVLIIKDDELRERCSDLLASPDNYDRVIREATTILEDRMRNKCPHETLSKLIPHSADQTGDALVNNLFSPDKPVLSISSDKHNRIAFHRILLGAVSYLRNPYHHKLDPNTEWSWAWSTVGFIDRLLTEIESCEVVQ